MSAVEALHFLPHMTIGIVVKYNAHAIHEAEMNILYRPRLSIHGVIVNTTIVPRPFRKNAIETKASPITYVEID